MRHFFNLRWVILATTAVAGFGSTPVRAFTNGTLLPPYLCDLEDLRNGSPPSLGAVVPLLVEDAANSMATIAGYHHRTSPYTAQDLCTASIATANQPNVTATTQFIVSTKNAGDPLIGLIAWVQDVPAAGLPRRIGTVTTPGLNMIYYPYRGCGNIGQTIVHSTALNDAAAVATQSAPFTWNLGADGVAGSTVQIRGVCVTDMGYGPFTVSLPACPSIANSYTGGTNYDGSGKGTCALTTATNIMKSTTVTMAATATTTTKAATTTTTAATTKAVTTLSTKQTMMMTTATTAKTTTASTMATTKATTSSTTTKATTSTTATTKATTSTTATTKATTSTTATTKATTSTTATTKATTSTTATTKATSTTTAATTATTKAATTATSILNSGATKPRQPTSMWISVVACAAAVIATVL
ncbi:hypothetical protein HK405_002091 [Cladochytrium tenue]|nr:hypothetical protein HK405_002091 [Cladochytrium tenue]